MFKKVEHKRENCNIADPTNKILKFQKDIWV